MKISKACFSHPLKIGIDCRMYGLKHAGIGRYIMNLVEELLKQDKENEYVLFIRKDDEIKSQISNLKKPASRNSFGIQNQNLNLKTVIVEAPHYSLREQLLLSSIIAKERVDLMHFPHFNVPVFYRGKYVVTIHDLIKHTSRGAETTTKSPFLYWLKFLGYKIVFRQAVKKAEKIITPSQFVKNEVIKEYGVKLGKVVVTYEGIDENLKSQISSLKSKSEILNLLGKYSIKSPFLLYVGSVYPHKNIERLIEAVEILNQSLTTNHPARHASQGEAGRQPLTTLVIVCARNVFSERLRNKIVQLEAQEFINLAGFVPDEDLSVLYQEAEAFIYPTLSEGFGLPGLEAMSFGCPVICSDIPVLREVYGEAAIYFDPLDSNDMAKKILKVMEKENKDKLRKEGEKQIKKYSWGKMAKETLFVYQSV